MSLYSDILLPRLCDLAMRHPLFAPYRAKVAGAATGRVLEIGIGSGLNLPFYGVAVTELLALEPAPRLLAMARRPAAASQQHVRFIEASAEAIPLDDNSVDSVVTTWTLCTVPQADIGLRELRRVLRPGGRLLFVEHGLAPQEAVRRWQHRLTPAWRRVTGGCHLDRPIQGLIESAGFEVDRITTGYVRGPKPMTYFYEGSARPR